MRVYHSVVLHDDSCLLPRPQLSDNLMTIPFYRTDLTDVSPAELRRLIPDLTERIRCQRARLQKIKLAGTGPSNEMTVLLADMIVRRDAMQARLVDIEAEPLRAEIAAPTTLRLVPRAAETLPAPRAFVDKGWRVELSCGRVNLRRARSNQ